MTGPWNAVKEMLENCIDAGATNILVVVKQGGLKLIQIQDNGKGIQKCDMEAVCERFATSKLTTFEDLSSISTYGFRGEALASISHVAHITITTKTAESQCAFKGSYSDGKLREPVKPCAGTKGTQITVEDLFYNVPTRKKAIKSATEEYNKVYEVVSKYAIHNSSIVFTLKKYGENATIRTQKGTTVDSIQTIYGGEVSRELIPIEYNDEQYKFKVEGHVSNANYNAKKCTLLLFINHRLVESSALKKALESVYTNYLPKGSHPFMYLSLEIVPENVDVNVHPTKHEVHFLHEEAIIESVQKVLENTLLDANKSRTFLTQAVLPTSFGASQKEDNKPKEVDKVYDHNFVRTDSKERKLESFVSSQSSDQTSNGTKKERKVHLKSVLGLRSEVENELNVDLREIFKEHKFVGCVERKYSLMQHAQELYLVDVYELSRDLFYQIMLYDFGNYGSISLEQPANILELARMALDLPEVGWTIENGPKEELAQQIDIVLRSHAELLFDYFSLEIDKEGNVISLPYLLENYIPPLQGLPIYILRLASDVDWTTEKECFEGVCKETSEFYAMGNGYEHLKQSFEKDWKWMTEYTLFPNFRNILLPTNTMANYLVKLASLPDLYRVFERC